jgi:hypothetical protein
MDLFGVQPEVFINILILLSLGTQRAGQVNMHFYLSCRHAYL